MPRFEINVIDKCFFSFEPKWYVLCNVTCRRDMLIWLLPKTAVLRMYTCDFFRNKFHYKHTNQNMTHDSALNLFFFLAEPLFCSSKIANSGCYRYTSTWSFQQTSFDFWVYVNLTPLFKLCILHKWKVLIRKPSRNVLKYNILWYVKQTKN